MSLSVLLMNWSLPMIILMSSEGLTKKKIPPLTLSEVNAAPPCQVFVDAGPDVDVCEGYFQLSGSVGGNVLGWFWSPESGLINPDLLNPVTYVDDSVSYTLTALAEDPGSPNILVNGDFEQGNVGFYTPYTYMQDLPGFQQELYSNGTYTVIDSPNLVNDIWPHCVDHTPLSGTNMLLFNGDQNIDTIWCQTVEVIPNSYYLFNGWVGIVDSHCPPELFVYVNGEYINSWANPDSFYPCDWESFAPGVWGSGNSTTAEICIIQDKPFMCQVPGLDFALDDLTFEGLCAKSDTVNINFIDDPAPVPGITGSLSVCAGEIETYTATFPPGTNITSYEWTLASGGTIISGEDSEQVSILWDNASAAEICLAIGTFCFSNSGCVNVEINTVPPATVFSGPLYYCPGEIGTLSVPEDASIDEYQWIIPSEINVLSGQGSNSVVIEWGTSLEEEVCIEMTNECGVTSSCAYLSLSPGYTTSFDTVLCNGSTITINGNIYGNGVLTGSELYTTIDGCDSIVTIEITEANPFEFFLNTLMCSGDSIFLQGAFQTQPGLYFDTLTTVNGCDSILITELSIVPFDTTWINSTTCDPASADTIITTFNLEGCDSTVIHAIVFSLADTTLLSSLSCSVLDTGQTTQYLLDSYGCDSIVVTNTYLAPTDTTMIYQSSCDSSDIGVFEQTFNNVYGCDSTIINTVLFSLADTSNIFSFTCSALDSGTTMNLLVNENGCDSLVIHHHIYAASDTIYFSGNTCNPLDTGVMITNFFNQHGCDSIVVSSTHLVSSDTTYIILSSCEPQDTGVSVQLLMNDGGCDSLVVTTTNLDPVEECELRADFSIEQALCYGDSAWLMIDILVGKGPLMLTAIHDDISGSAQYVSTGLYYFPLDSNFQGGELMIKLISVNGIILTDTFFIEAPVPIDIEAEVGSDYNGYGVRCHGENNGEAFVNILMPGHPPLELKWSNGETSQNNMNFAAGIYQVIAEDNRGCRDSSSVIITEPFPIKYDVHVDDISCFGQQDGQILLAEIEGGVAPLLASLDGNPPQSNLLFDQLTAGLHHVVVQDMNGCTMEEALTILEPENWFVDLGSDTTFETETIFNLSVVIHGVPHGQLEWKWSDQQFDNVSSRIVVVNSNVTYGVTATDENGCSSFDEIVLALFNNSQIFVPNIFSPNGDQVNDRFLISAGSGVKEIKELTIYDRWGNQVFGKTSFLLGDPFASWDGRLNNKDLQTGVYTYHMIVLYHDEKHESLYGNITLIR